MKINNKEIQINIDGIEHHCPMGLAMNFIGGKWKATILWYLRNGKMRFGEIGKTIPQITDRVLSIALRQLEDDGLIIREVYSVKPPLKVDYSLTDFGKSLLPVLESISKWGYNYGRVKGNSI